MSNENQNTNALAMNMDLPTDITPRGGNMAAMLFDLKYFEHLQRVANMFSKSNLVPKHYQTVSDCCVAFHMAYAAGIDPLFVLQNTQVVHGIPGWKGQAIIALINTSKKFSKPLNWEFKRDDSGEVVCATCYTTNADGERLEASVTWDMVTGEQWNKDKPLKYGDGVQKSKWNTMREQMFAYRSATFFARRYCPEILLGLAAEGEQEDTTSNTRGMREVFGKSEKSNRLNALTAESEADDDEKPNTEVKADPINSDSPKPATEGKANDNTGAAVAEKVPPLKTSPLTPAEANDMFGG